MGPNRRAQERGRERHLARATAISDREARAALCGDTGLRLATAPRPSLDQGHSVPAG